MRCVSNRGSADSAWREQCLGAGRCAAVVRTRSARVWTFRVSVFGDCSLDLGAHPHVSRRRFFCIGARLLNRKTLVAAHSYTGGKFGGARCLSLMLLTRVLPRILLRGVGVCGVALCCGVLCCVVLWRVAGCAGGARLYIPCASLR
jgi:hypothetical protein